MDKISVIFYVVLCYLIFIVLFYLMLKIVTSNLGKLVFFIDSLVVRWLRAQIRDRTREEKLNLPMLVHIKLNRFYYWLIYFEDKVNPKLSNVLRIRLVNIGMFVFSYHFINDYNLANALYLTWADGSSFSKNLYRDYLHLNPKARIWIAGCLFIPMVYSVYNHLSFKILRVNRYLEPYTNFFVNLLQKIEKNMNTIRLEKDVLVQNQIRELVGGLPYNFSHGELVAHKIEPEIFSEDRNLTIKQLNKFAELKVEFDALNKRNQKNNLKHPVLIKTLRVLRCKFSRIFENHRYGLLYHEQPIFLDTFGNKMIQRCRDFFSENQNQIYKHKFTQARVIRAEVLKDLPYYENELANILKKFTEDLEDYYFCLFENKTRVEESLNKLVLLINDQRVVDHLKMLLKSIMMSYLLILRKLIF